MPRQDEKMEQLEAFLGDRFAQCIREHSGQGRTGDESFIWANPYVQDCMKYLKSRPTSSEGVEWPAKNGKKALESPELECDSPELNQMIGWDKCHEAFMAVINGQKKEFSGYMTESPKACEHKEVEGPYDAPKCVSCGADVIDMTEDELRKQKECLTCAEMIVPPDVCPDKEIKCNIHNWNTNNNPCPFCKQKDTDVEECKHDSKITYARTAYNAIRWCPVCGAFEYDNKWQFPKGYRKEGV